MLNFLENSPAGPPLSNDGSFYLRFFYDVGALRDEAGAPLHEVDFREEQPGQAYKKCPFHDSRRNFLINRLAFERMSKTWKELGDVLNSLNVISNPDLRKIRDIRDVWRCSLVMMFYPLYLRRKNGLEGFAIDPVVADTFKAMLDVPTTLDLMLFSMVKSDAYESEQWPAKIYEFADHHKLLINGQYSCAGPKNLIVELLNQVCEPNKVSATRIEVELEEYQKYFNICAMRYASSQIFQAALMLCVEYRQYYFSDYKNIAFEFENSAYETRRRFILKCLSDAGGLKAIINTFSNAARGTLSVSDGTSGSPTEDLFKNFCDHVVGLEEVLAQPRNEKLAERMEDLCRRFKTMQTKFEDVTEEEFEFKPLAFRYPVADDYLNISGYFNND